MTSLEGVTSHLDTGPELDPGAFARVSSIAAKVAGLCIPETKRPMVQSRLAKRLRATGHPDFLSYLDLVESPRGHSELPEFVSALTTNVSSFFREMHHFETLKENVFPALADKLRAGHRIRLWSAGCSTGQEPYSIAIALLESDPDFGRGDVRILATDVDRSVLDFGRTGEFEARQIEPLDSDLVARHFERQGTEGNPTFTVSARVRSLVSFRSLNLIDPWPMRGLFDVIFCRNVLIYFSEETQQGLWPRFHAAMAPEGWLFIGHSERVANADAVGFRPSGVTTYRKSPGSKNDPQEIGPWP